VALLGCDFFLAGTRGARPERLTVTKEHARKKAIRARMAASGEPYSVAARRLHSPALADDDAAGADTAAVSEIAACAARTWAEPSARIEARHDWDVSRSQQPDGGDGGWVPGPFSKLAWRVGRAAWKRLSGGAEFGHGRLEGFIELARSRYMIDSGSYAVLSADGETFSGRAGRSLRTLLAERQEGTELWLLRLPLGVTDARPEGTETLRGTSCRRYAVQVELSRAEAATGADLRHPLNVDPLPSPVLALTVWTDGRHVRRVRFEEHGQDRQPEAGGFTVAKALTVELWEFGVPVGALDWSRLPDFPAPA
jgi:hypothetical protein